MVRCDKASLDGGQKAALITEYMGPETATHLEWWPMYLVGSQVYFQNHLLFFDQLAETFSLEKVCSFVREREAVDEDGRKISEWAVSLSEVEAFAFSTMTGELDSND